MSSFYFMTVPSFNPHASITKRLNELAQKNPGAKAKNMEIRLLLEEGPSGYTYHDGYVAAALKKTSSGWIKVRHGVWRSIYPLKS